MGLDMYLKAEKSISDWSLACPKERRQYADTLKLAGLSEFTNPECPSAEVRVTVAYWRKANAIHKWFVDHCQEGVDDCRDACVSRDQLAELVNTCKAVLARAETGGGDPAVALPTKAGGFFGSTDYGESYLADLRSTIKQIEPLLAEKFHEEFDVYYHANW
jgi:hypothetical protein